MSTITTNDGTRIFYKDWGAGLPVVFSHGWPVTADAWDPQMVFLGERELRVVAHDRGSHGRSEQTRDGNDMNTYADDVAELLEQLETLTRACARLQDRPEGAFHGFASTSHH